MKIVHLSDLHIGKRVFAFSMLEDQQYILNQILSLISAMQPVPDAVVIAGDVYDKSVPSVEAVQLFDAFLVRLSEIVPHTFLISGNHDSAERLAFGGTLMEKSGVHVSPVYNGEVSSVSLFDEWGEVNFFLLPFVKPAQVRKYAEQEIESYSDAVDAAVRQMQVDEKKRNVLITHQFVTGAARCESEEISVGGTDNVSADVFAPFDYTALGHIHSPQNVTSERIRYCGTPLAYSFSECRIAKSLTVVTLKEKGSLMVEEIPLTPKRVLREIKGTYLHLTARDTYKNTNTDDYLHITLTDEQDIPNAAANLRVIYPNLMKLDYDNLRTRNSGEQVVLEQSQLEQKSPYELFAAFYEQQNNQPMEHAKQEIMRKLFDDLWGGQA